MPSRAASAARPSAAATSSPLSCLRASRAGPSASSIVLSPRSALPRLITPCTPASRASVKPATSSSDLPVAAWPICMNSVPYRGPAAPPTLETSAIPTAFSDAPMSSPSVVSRRSSTFFIPRSMFVPWSPSPMAPSSLVRYARFSATSAANRVIQSSIASCVIVTGLRAAPLQGDRVDRRVPQPLELVVEPQQRDRAARHLQRGDVGPDEVARDRDPAPLQVLVQLVVDDVQLDQRRAAHPVDEGEHLVALLVRDVLDDRVRQPLDSLRRRLELHALAPRLAVDADADLHLVRAEREVRLAGRRRDARRQRHAHAAALVVHVAADVRDVLERLALLGRRAADLLREHGHADAAPAGRIEAVLDGHVVVRHHRRDLDPLGGRELRGHLEVHDVARVVLDDVQDAGPTVHGLRGLVHLVRRGRGEHLARTGGVEHAVADEAALHRLPPPPPPRGGPPPPPRR